MRFHDNRRSVDLAYRRCTFNIRNHKKNVMDKSIVGLKIRTCTRLKV
jgi:hypothetical protein